ncbi:hypothetical protein [Allobaculum sp. Allo2]|uniref:hypothetical protein n=1 Tax=Allobaculum sp. Allo2 TaxID=2853432 RepID=UPI001F61F0FC|nr:hypothetical protein [Allobaculum sp. Allo2]UNT92996.1 hypothetical protein KWG61_13245 [Allobaculum sp. Allo2]
MTRNDFNTLIVTLKDENGKLSYLSDTASAFWVMTSMPPSPGPSIWTVSAL